MPTPPRALVVYESMFGNTKAIANAVADGLRSRRYGVTTVDVQWVTTTQALDVDLLVVGAPTHAFSLSRPSTRADAVKQGAPAVAAATGLREWLGGVHAGSTDLPPVAVFDTRVARVRRLPTAAARTAAKIARRRGFRLLDGTQGFAVDGTRGPLLPGELQRAVEWGQDLADLALRMKAGT